MDHKQIVKDRYQINNGSIETWSLSKEKEIMSETINSSKVQEEIVSCSPFISGSIKGSNYKGITAA